MTSLEVWSFVRVSRVAGARSPSNRGQDARDTQGQDALATSDFAVVSIRSRSRLCAEFPSPEFPENVMKRMIRGILDVAQVGVEKVDISLRSGLRDARNAETILRHGSISMPWRRWGAHLHI
jgi:hypothetical protein